MEPSNTVTILTVRSAERTRVRLLTTRHTATGQCGSINYPGIRCFYLRDISFFSLLPLVSKLYGEDGRSDGPGNRRLARRGPQ
jgi:hypothetical protein